ncbi:MAG: helicase-related protein, partial [Chloroflexi bacterium]|nr:helicase-related protein [Chloroflexota bacterium]
EVQIDVVLLEIDLGFREGQRVLVTTLTQRMSEELAGYINELGIKGQYLHAEVDTLERVEILRDLRMGVYDVVVGINLLREGLDLPEVSLVAILDADKSGFLRSEPALIQTIGRAARHVEGKVIMYADAMTPAMEGAINETDRRRLKQELYNLENGIEPQQIVKDIQDITDRLRAIDGDGADEDRTIDAGLAALPAEELQDMIEELEREMRKAADAMEFEKAAALRDQIFDLQGALVQEQGLEGDLMMT